MKTKRPYPRRDRKIVDRVLSGETYAQVSKDYGLQKERVRQIVLGTVRRATIDIDSLPMTYNLRHLRAIHDQLKPYLSDYFDRWECEQSAEAEAQSLREVAERIERNTRWKEIHRVSEIV